LFGSVWVSDGVIFELEQGAKTGCKTPDLDRYSWVCRVSATVPEDIDSVENLGQGEKEVIALGLVTPNAVLILDDLLARQIAKREGLSMIGTLGILLAAKKQALIREVKPVLERLVSHKFRLSHEVAAQVLEQAGE
jgi:predicted nucleic acid-binding protein